MDSFIARQPIFNDELEAIGYELLYRDMENKDRAVFTDGNLATSRLLSDAIHLFGLPKLTNGKPAFVNFTDILIMNDFVYLANADDIVVEVLEDVEINDAFVEKISILKDNGYQIALDDYIGGEGFDRMLPFVDYLKVDFMQTDRNCQTDLAALPKQYPNIKLLAEKVETEREFLWAREQGYELFQGYFFAKPLTMRKKIPNLSVTTYSRIMRELNRKSGINFSACAGIIHHDALMTYRTLQKTRTLKYYRGNLITAVKSSLVMMGEDEVRRWILLLLARDNNITHSDELVKQAYLRGCFARKLSERCVRRCDKEYAFLVGMLSMLDQILGLSMPELLDNIAVPKEVRLSLLKKEDTIYRRILEYIEDYENGASKHVLFLLGMRLSEEEVIKLYMESIVMTDTAFNQVDAVDD